MSRAEVTDGFSIERRGDLIIIVPAAHLESLGVNVAEDAADLLLEPIRAAEVPLVIIDLAHVDYFGSSFLSLLLKCWKAILEKNGQMALAGVSSRARELLRITSLDIVWPIYDDRAEAIAGLAAD